MMHGSYVCLLVLLALANGEEERSEISPFAPGWFSECVGFGCAVTKTYNHVKCTVSSLTEAALKNCVTNTNRHVTFSTSGTIKLSAKVKVAQGVILDGGGKKIVFTGEPLVLASKNIVYNFRFDSGKDDAITIKGTFKDIWVHRCSFRNYGDGLLDITRGAQRITVSWCKFADHDKTMLIGTWQADDKDTSDITLHHNYWLNCRQRQPRTRYAYVHIYNSVYENWSSYAIGSSQLSRVLVENTWFRATDAKAAAKAMVIKVGEDPRSGYIRALGNYYGPGSRKAENQRDRVGSPSYKYTLEKADSALYNKVKSGAGAK